jgi:hypothetical protein
MKKSSVALLSLLFVAGFAFAAGKAAAPGASAPLFAPGDLSVQAGVGTSLFYGFDVYGGADYGIGSFKIADNVPLTYGAAARVSYYSWSDSFIGYTDSYYDIGVGALATLRLDWKDVFPGVGWLSKIESYVGLGLGMYDYGLNVGGLGSSSSFNFGFAGLEGNNWYFAPRWALNLEEGYFGYGGDLRLGILYKF